METLLQDFRYAVRKLARTPGFTAVAAMTLALAVGANTAIFSVVNGVLLKPLPFKEPAQLVRVSNADNKTGKPFMAASALDFLDWRAQSHSFTGIVAYSDGTLNLTGGGEPERIRTAQVTGNFWDVLGVRAAVGRNFAEGDDKLGAARVIVLGDGLWKRRFGGDRQVIGKTITLDGQAYTVIGIAPRTLTYPEKPDAWVPLVFQDWMISPDNRGAHWLSTIARLKPNVTPEMALADMKAVTRHLEEQYPQSNTNFGAFVKPLQEQMVGNVKGALYVMLGAVAFVLLIACANVANLLLVRAASREGEMAVRTALGAGRSRIIRQLVTESVLLSLVGGSLGALLAWWGVDLLRTLGPSNIPRLNEVRIDGTVLGVTAGVTLLTGLLFGLLPALHAARPQLGQMLREGGRGSAGRRGHNRIRSALVVSEMAMAMVLLIGAGLLIRSFVRLLHVDPGFRTEHVITFNISLPGTRYPSGKQQLPYQDELLRRMKSVPGAQSVALTLNLPMAGGMMRTSLHIEGTPDEAPGERKLSSVANASADYFKTMGIPLLKGRAFTDADRTLSKQVAIISQETAKRYFPNEDPIGKVVRLGIGIDTAGIGGNPNMGGEIIGVVGDVKGRALNDEAYPQTYFPYTQMHGFGDMSVVVRTAADPGAVIPAMRAQARAIDPEVPIYDVQTMEQRVMDSVAQPRFYTMLLGLFAAIALTLAAIGIYGVISYAVAQRTRELGIRIALGATRDQVVRLVLSQGMVLTLVGAAIGVGTALYVTRLLASMLFGVSAMDPVTFGGVSAVLLAVAVMACWLPARRAARVDPVIAMRAE